MTLSFGDAINALEQGKMARRKSWADSGKFVFRQVPSIIKKEIVPKMQSLPESVKKEFQKRFDFSNNQIDAIYYQDQFALVNSSNLITSWCPTVPDSLAKDWEVLPSD
ncbi:Thoeris anti-defense Tad2 family protein [Croceimicrobium hydrocarbonivorans]|uniref:DUF2829 domain-containing protein n=1 Tax=Croceimicrobium hydrocarbonivorans TaxID=2761580 RepID=A0A7H0VBC2_9FLAO|nr:MW1434 family type I TA system toxin [Croceimicrobium hydrocarbonivorans]QNR22974.1 DUF2829 domain-containing protein [Croceimicrobium hydrocarbonivorans]QNR23020.1 DUF2829 domain-containing protein [Croceimicrobium hydrocarbonivorans]